MQSYSVALLALQNDSHVDADQVFLFGHSIGSLMAPRLANQSHVAGVVVAEAVGRNWFEYELANLRRQLELEKLPPAQVDDQMAGKEVCMHELLVQKQPEAEIERVHADCREHNAYPVSAGYLQELAALNVAQPWTALPVPVLVIYGTADFVTAEADHRRIVDSVNSVRPGSATLKLIEGMDHQLGSSGNPGQAYDLHVKQKRESDYDAELSAAVLDWLCQKASCTSG